MEEIMPAERIEKVIYFLRDKKVILDFDLAKLYCVEVRHLKRQVRRNILRFPDDFMFQLSVDELEVLRCHFGTLKRGKHSKYLPYAFTENGIAMLSSVLNSERAIFVNIQIMRTFTKLREILSTHKDLREKIEKMEKKYDHQFKAVFDAIKALIETPEKGKKKYGFV